MELVSCYIKNLSTAFFKQILHISLYVLLYVVLLLWTTDQNYWNVENYIFLKLKYSDLTKYILVQKVIITNVESVSKLFNNFQKTVNI